MKEEVWDAVKNLGIFLKELDKRLRKLEKEVDLNCQLLRTTEERVIELEGKVKKLE